MGLRLFYSLDDPARNQPDMAPDRGHNASTASHLPARAHGPQAKNHHHLDHNLDPIRHPETKTP